MNITDYNIIFNTLAKDNSNSEKEAGINLSPAEGTLEAPADEQTARDIIQSLFFSESIGLGEVGRHRDQQEAGAECRALDQRVKAPPRTLS